MVNAITGDKGKISDETVTSKVLGTPLPIYVIRVSIVQELRYNPSNDLTLDSLVGRLIAFELWNFDIFTTPTIESSFKSQLVLNKSKKKKGKYEDSESEPFDDYLEDLEALMVRREPRGKGKFKGKLPIIYFSCNKVFHITRRCPDKEDKDEKKRL